MIIIGANGLGKELLTLLSWNNDTDNLYFFDEDCDRVPDLLYGRFPVLKSWAALTEHFLINSPEFALGVGTAVTRKLLSDNMTVVGVPAHPIKSKVLIHTLVPRSQIQRRHG